MRIVQITDLHLRSSVPGTSEIPERLSREVPELFSQTVKRVMAEVSPELLVVSGDLVDVPFDLVARLDRDEATGEEKNSVLEDYRLVRNQLDASGCPYMVLPGNHDWPGAFDSVFPDQTPVRTLGSVTVLTFPHDREGAGNIPYRNVACYRDYEAVTGITVHVQHYVVTPRLDTEYPHTYGNAEEIIRWNALHGPPVLSISGHYHPGTAPHHREDTAYCVGAAFCEYPHPWYVYQIAPDSGRVTIRNYC
jgi:3',5'-cyclic AMP phosphodiesterase CpdA